MMRGSTPALILGLIILLAVFLGLIVLVALVMMAAGAVIYKWKVEGQFDRQHQRRVRAPRGGFVPVNGREESERSS